MITAAPLRAQARQLDVDQHWQDVPGEWIERFAYSLSFLDPKGFQYYLPAFMIWTLDHLSAESEVVQPTILALCPTPRFSSWYKERFAVFTDAQNQAICQFLRFMVGHDPFAVARVSVALDAYWGQFCQQ